MKQLYFSILLLVLVGSVNAQAYFNYNLQWATYSKQPLLYQEVNHTGDMFIVSGTSTPYPSEFMAVGDTIGRYVIGQLNTNGTYDYVKMIGGQGGSYFRVSSVTADESGNFYVGGSADTPTDVATVGAHQENFAANMSLIETIYVAPGVSYQTTSELCTDGYIMKYDAQGNKLWGTYFNGDQLTEGLDITYHNGFLYVTGSTSSNSGLATTGTLMSTYPGTIYNSGKVHFLAKFNATTSELEWATYLPFSLQESTGVVIDSQNNIYVEGWALNTTNIYKIDTEGTQILDTLQVPEINNLTKMEIDDVDNFYFFGRTTQASGVATANTYRTTISSGTEYCLVKYDVNMNKLWGTYLYNGEAVNNLSAKNTDFCFDKVKNTIYCGRYTNIDGLATAGVYQTAVAGDYDNFFLKLNHNGQLLWYSYYGGVNEEGGYMIIRVDDNENMYLGALTKSAAGIASGNGLYQYGDLPLDYGVLKYYVAKFANSYLGVEDVEKYQATLYPNPANDVVHLMSTYMLSPQVQITVYNIAGEMVLQINGIGANEQPIAVKSLTSGTYIVKIEDTSSGFSKTLKFLKK